MSKPLKHHSMGIHEYDFRKRSSLCFLHCSLNEHPQRSPIKLCRHRLSHDNDVVELILDVVDPLEQLYQFFLRVQILGCNTTNIGDGDGSNCI